MHKIRPPLFPAHIFTPYGVRGVYSSEFHEKAAYAIARAFVSHLLLRKPDHRRIQVVVSHDAGEDSVVLYNAFIGGLLDEGAHVIDIGCAMPSLNTFAILQTHSDGGVMFSTNLEHIASMKLCGADAAPIGEGLGLEEIRNSATRGIFTSIGGGATLQNGTRTQTDVLASLADFFVTRFQDLQSTSASLAVAGDDNAVVIFQRIVERFPGIHIERMGVASTPGRISVRYAVDEKTVLYDELGHEISSDVVAAFFVASFAKEGDRIVRDIRVSKIVSEAAEFRGAKTVSCRVGDVFLRDCMRREGALLGVDPQGCFYFKDFFFATSGVYTALMLLRAMNGASQPLSELVAPYKKYAKSSQISFRVKNSEQCIDSLAASFHDAQLSYEDGVVIAYTDWWCNVRPSNTEDVLRVTVEADTEDLLEKKIKLLTELISVFVSPQS